MGDGNGLRAGKARSRQGEFHARHWAWRQRPLWLRLHSARRPSKAREVVHFLRRCAGRPAPWVVRTSERRLYYVLGDGTAVRYPVGVGRAGQTWKGSARSPANTSSRAGRPPEVIKRARPTFPDLIPGGTPENPMGAAALTLSEGEYAIHGTNRPIDRRLRLVRLYPYVQSGTCWICTIA